MIAVTGATGQLGRLVIHELLKTQPANSIIAAVRSPEKAEDLADLGVVVRQADYDQPATLATAFNGAKKLLLISSSEIGKRASQHSAVIDAANASGVTLIAYTSLLHADTSPLALAQEHVITEQKLAESGVPFVLLRNGWYTENYLASIPSALEHGAFIGAAGNGKIASAPRADYAAAAAAVMASPQDQAGNVYELAGDTAYTLAELAHYLSETTGNTIQYQNLPEAEFAKVLVGAGLPEGFANILADSDAGAAKGALFDSSHQLSQLIGRNTTPLTLSMNAAL
ncbi:SDR family oxidoreductase [Neptunomonas sp. CHC150]|uniref:SDR family oxidoreductase n=1 Tax=Neptunomonas sp. CHC150 TaxID=2998324 RepID=UPI0025B25EBD|nr:SDR family oxidoreductase [Neptunomonas sp. CHC150]MDN2660125.1 SDR family oxidoreductase [Neptunomonas sp. CHC150]